MSFHVSSRYFRGMTIVERYVSVDMARGVRGSAISGLSEALISAGRRVGYYFYCVVVCPDRFFETAWLFLFFLRILARS